MKMNCDTQTEDMRKKVNINRDRQTDIFLVTGDYRWLWVVSGGFGCLWVLTP